MVQSFLFSKPQDATIIGRQLEANILAFLARSVHKYVETTRKFV